jgi:hypothetical protein
MPASSINSISSPLNCGGQRRIASPMEQRFTTTTKSAAVLCTAFGGKLCVGFLAVAYLTGLLLQISVNHASYPSSDHDEWLPSSWDYVLSTPEFSEYSWYPQENATEEFTADDDGAPRGKEADNDQSQLDDVVQDSEEEGETVDVALEKIGANSTNERPVAKLPLPIINVGFPKVRNARRPLAHRYPFCLLNQIANRSFSTLRQGQVPFLNFFVAMDSERSIGTAVTIRKQQRQRNEKSSCPRAFFII